METKLRCLVRTIRECISDTNTKWFKFFKIVIAKGVGFFDPLLSGQAETIGTTISPLVNFQKVTKVDYDGSIFLASFFFFFFISAWSSWELPLSLPLRPGMVSIQSVCVGSFARFISFLLLFSKQLVSLSPHSLPF